MRRSEQKEIRRQEILTAGLDLFIRKGYAATKIKDIAQAVDMSVGLMFNYFDSKEKLYEELIRLGLSGPQSLMAGMGGEPLEFFETAARQIFRLLETDPFVAKMFVLMTQALYNEAAPEAVRSMLEGVDFNAPSAEIIKQGQLSGSIREGDPAALAVAFWGAVSGIAEEIALMPGVSVPDSDWIVDILRKKG